MHLATPMKRSPRNKSQDYFWRMLQNLLSFHPSRDNQSELNLEQEALKLSARDSKIFIDAIENPPEPSEGLLSVFE